MADGPSMFAENRNPSGDYAVGCKTALLWCGGSGVAYSYFPSDARLLVPHFQPSIRPVNITWLRKRDKSFGANGRGWGRYLQASIDPVGVEIGAAFVAHGDQRPAKGKHTIIAHSQTHSQRKKLGLVR